MSFPLLSTKDIDPVREGKQHPRIAGEIHGGIGDWRPLRRSDIVREPALGNKTAASGKLVQIESFLSEEKDSALFIGLNELTIGPRMRRHVGKRRHGDPHGFRGTQCESRSRNEKGREQNLFYIHGATSNFPEPTDVFIADLGDSLTAVKVEANDTSDRADHASTAGDEFVTGAVDTANSEGRTSEGQHSRKENRHCNQARQISPIAASTPSGGAQGRRKRRPGR